MNSIDNANGTERPDGTPSAVRAMERGMVDPSVAKQLVEVIIKNLPAPVPGQRPVHTLGIGVKGKFVASNVARTYCTAEHFNGKPVDASVRFSNGLGGPERHDGWSDVRGMATRFHLSDGTASDLIATTLAEFFVRNVEEFFGFSEVATLAPYQRETWWSKLGDLLQLKVPRRNPYPSEKKSVDAGALHYADQHRFAQLGIFQVGLIGAPVSYARAAYHAVHTFWVTAPNGVRRPVRFSWQPVAGVCNTDPLAAPRDDYLRAELRDRLRRWPARFMLMMTIGEAGDELNDPTKPWPGTRIRIAMGTLTLIEVAEDQEKAGERISFNPNRLAPGIEPSEDPILKARLGAYEASREMRGGCPFKWRPDDAK
ncbi:catalase [Bradyrhizobium sp. 6(2017)]|uniref:catalase n=1 Tax=Bradyrhizobium sp. 6(2017) TaxID=1197460 RepID=UPI0013E1B198|nr:catalase [Bradyrhizobium sp. 6(2017)]QIG96230.1 catalase [Bradyrhizobium sp. 6(2017)]